MMPIWNQEVQLKDVQQMGKGTMVEHTGIEIIAIGENYLKGTMPVDHRTTQPMGILHGGASVVLAETLGSIAANLVVDNNKNYCVGLDINANHLRQARTGPTVTGIAKPVHIGKSTQVWSIEIFNEEDQLVCVSRITMAVLSLAAKR